jgi:hypothetical protein
MATEDPHRPAAAAAKGRSVASTAFSVTVVVVSAAALFLTWLRLFVGMDLQDESYYVLLPWRWVLGDRPFVHEQNMLQFPGLLAYPFEKLFGIVRGNDPTGLVLYMRHVYLLMMIAVAVGVFLLLRKLTRWQLALLVAAGYVTFIFMATPQLSYNTMALAFLTLCAVFGARVVLGLGGSGYACASGAALGIAIVAYPSLLVLVPFFAVFFVFAQGRRAAAVLAEGAVARLPDPPGPPTGLPAWRALRMWVLGGLLVLVPIGALVLSFGPRNLVRSWRTTMAGARVLHQLGGSAKALEVAQGVVRFIMWRPYLVVAALLIYLVYRRYPRLGRALLALLPLALWLAGQRALMAASGYVLIYVLLAPYLYLFVSRERREVGARLLLWVWAPSLLAGAMTAYTSAAGYVAAAIGLSPGLMASGLFLCWALEAVAEPAVQGAPAAGSVQLAAAGSRGGPARLPWLALAVLTAIVAVPVSFQFQYQERDVPFRTLTSRFDSGPWWGIKVAPERRAQMDAFAADLRAQARPGDELLIYYRGEGYYLYWKGPIAADTYWLGPGPGGELPRSTVDYYRRNGVVPTLAVHLLPTVGMSDAELTAASGRLGYPPMLVRPTYVFARKPAGETTAGVIARLSRH